MLQMKGKQSVLFQEPVKIMSHACVGGKKEGEGPIGKHLDLIVDDPMFGKENWEESESSFLKTAGEIAIQKRKKEKGRCENGFLWGFIRTAHCLIFWNC